MITSTTNLRRSAPLLGLIGALACSPSSQQEPSSSPTEQQLGNASSEASACGDQQYRIEGSRHCFEELACAEDLTWSRREHACLPTPPGSARHFKLSVAPNESSEEAPTRPRAGTALWTAQNFSELKASLKAEGLLPTSFPIGGTVFEGSLLNVVTAWRRDSARAQDANERLQAVIDSPEPDVLSALEAMFLQARIAYALFVRLYDSSPQLFDPDDAEKMLLADESGEPALEQKAKTIRREVAAKWVQRRAEELNARAAYFVPRLAWALQYATEMGAPTELQQRMQRLLYTISLELIGLEGLLPAQTTTARQFIASSKDCPPWAPGAGADFVPPHLVVAPGDPQGTFTLKEATAGLLGRGALTARLDTSLGSLSCELYSDQAPYTVANFVGLARGLRATRDPQGNWSPREAYVGTPFHRIIKGFMAQGGDPTGSGAGDSGYIIPNERWPGAVFNRRGLLAMANRGPDTNGMQFFITDGPAPHLNQGYTIFGYCEPNETLTRLMNLPTGGLDRPLELPIIQKITVQPEFACQPSEEVD